MGKKNKRFSVPSDELNPMPLDGVPIWLFIVAFTVIFIAVVAR